MKSKIRIWLCGFAKCCTVVDPKTSITKFYQIKAVVEASLPIAVSN